MRRVFILILLLGGMQLILPLGAKSHGSETLLSFGFLVLAAYTAGELATAAKLPKIVGYLAAGLLFGPSGLGTVTRSSTVGLAPVSSLAIALIAFLAGAELRWSEVKARGATITKILASELGLSFVALAVTLFVLRGYVPFLDGLATREAIVFSVLFASIAIVHSPAVTMALLTETKAGGPVARTTLGIVLVSDVVVVLLFSGMLAIARGIVPSTAAEVGAASTTSVVWELGGAVIVGGALGSAVALYLRFVRQELFLFALVVTFFGAEIARLAHVETLLMLLTAGFVTENFSRFEDGEAIRHAMERAAAPVFVVFFALAGAEMVPGEVVAVWFIVVPIVLVRGAAIWGGTRIGVRWSHADPQLKQVWWGLISQAGVAIGLATAVAQAYPVRGTQIKTLFLAVLALNQIIGPIVFRHALAQSGEIIAPDGPAAPEPASLEDRPVV
jgi:Kef-type K+ transport system membrane component KefB